MAELVALKVRIGLHDHGHAKYPDFGSLPIIQASGIDWSHWIDRYGSGWHYSKCGHKDHEEDSPMGEQWGMLLIPREFAEQAVSADPDCCSIMSDEEAGEFYECKVCRDMPDVHHDAETLAGIAAEIDLHTKIIEAMPDGPDKDKHVALREQAIERAKQAVDPDHDHPGVKTNHDKCWHSHKAKHGHVVQ